MLHIYPTPILDTDALIQDTTQFLDLCGDVAYACYAATTNVSAFVYSSVSDSPARFMIFWHGIAYISYHWSSIPNGADLKASGNERPCLCDMHELEMA